MDSGLGRSLESQTANTTQRMFEATMRVPDVGFYHSHEYERVKDAMDTAGVVTIILKGECRLLLYALMTVTMPFHSIEHPILLGSDG